MAIVSYLKMIMIIVYPCTVGLGDTAVSKNQRPSGLVVVAVVPSFVISCV